MEKKTGNWNPEDKNITQKHSNQEKEENQKNENNNNNNLENEECKDNNKHINKNNSITNNNIKLGDQKLISNDLKNSPKINNNNPINNTNNTNNFNNNQKNIISRKFEKKELPISEWACHTTESYKFDPENAVGKGRYGTVYKAYVDLEYAKKNNIPKIVALKLISTAMEKEGFPLTALREIMILKRLNNKNVIDLLEVIISKREKNIIPKVYLVFEYMDNDLAGIIDRQFKFNKSQIKYIMYEILNGLKYLHKNCIFHRDLKPQNILINNKGEIKIGDFGLSRIVNYNNIKKKYTNKVVTVPYRAPELFLGEEGYDGGVDIWSMGCIFWELLTNNMLFRQNENYVFLEICKKMGTPNEKIWPGISKYPNYKIVPKVEYKREIENIKKNYDKIDDITFDLFDKMMKWDPKKRIKIDDILNHKYFTEHQPKMCNAEDMPKFEEEIHCNYPGKNNKKEIKEHDQYIAKYEYSKKNINSSNCNNNFIGKKRDLDEKKEGK